MSAFLKTVRTALKVKLDKQTIDGAIAVKGKSAKVDQAVAGKLDWEKLTVDSEGKAIETAIANVAQNAKLVAAARKQTYTTPEPEGQTKFSNVLKVADKHGFDSKEVKRAIGIYVAFLDSYDHALEKHLIEIRSDITILGAECLKAYVLRDTAAALASGFEEASKVTATLNTGIGAKMVSLHIRCFRLARDAGGLGGSLKSLQDDCVAAQKAVEERKKRNKLWMDWAGAVVTSKGWKKNARAKKPS